MENTNKELMEKAKKSRADYIRNRRRKTPIKSNSTILIIG